MHCSRVFLGAALAALVVACGNDVSEDEASQDVSGGNTLCFNNFQNEIYPRIMNATLPVDLNLDGTPDANASCANSGCHFDGGNSGGAFRMGQNTPTIDVTTATRDQVLNSPMYANFLAAKGFANLAQSTQSKILLEPSAQVSHGGGRIFVNLSTPGSCANILLNWINLQPTDGDTLNTTVCSTAPPPPPPPACTP